MTAVALPGGVTAARDRLNRPLRDLRISVTDRCNFRCAYCMPRAQFGRGHHFLGADDLLSVDEIVRLAAVFVSLGVEKIRLTGGEPLLRRELATIVERLAALPLRDLALTTNGAMLARWAERLERAGLHRVTVSLDSLDPDVFATMSDTRVPVATVVDGIIAARDAGLGPVKLNCVVRRGINESGILDLVDFARRERLTLRFIEYMDVGTSNGWRREEVVSGAEILALIAAVHPLDAADATPNEVARRYRFADGGGEVGVITSVTRPFCGDCSRARLSADGTLYTCLFAATGLDLRGPIRQGADDEALTVLIASRWRVRDDRYSEVRSSVADSVQRIEMSYIGG